MKKIIFIVSLLFFYTQVGAQVQELFYIAVSGPIYSNNNVQSYVPYTYVLYEERPGGISSVNPSATAALEYVTWTVVNGKIQDANGNYTLTTIRKLAENPIGHVFKDLSQISVMWDSGAYGYLKAEMPSAYPVSYTIPLVAFNGSIVNQTMNEERYYEFGTITMRNVTINSGANITLNGYQSVIIQSEFHAKAGSTVHIYNGSPRSSAAAALQSDLLLLPEKQSNGKSALLYQNFPNPFNHVTTVSCYIPEESQIASIRIMNIMGQTVRQIPIEHTGTVEIEVESSNLVSGMYLYSLAVDGNIINTRRMIIAH